jgi:hypothetical protein
MESLSLIRKLLPYTSVMTAIAALCVGWTFFSRWNENRTSEKAAEAERAKANAKIVEMYGSGNLKILNFYAIRRTDKTLLCYGASNATAVRIEPGVEALKPSLSRCVEVAPKSTTQYTLTAEDAAGHQATESVVVQAK